MDEEELEHDAEWISKLSIDCVQKEDINYNCTFTNSNVKITKQSEFQYCLQINDRSLTRTWNQFSQLHLWITKYYDAHLLPHFPLNNSVISLNRWFQKIFQLKCL